MLMNQWVKFSLFLAAPFLLCLALLWLWRELSQLRRENQSLREAVQTERKTSPPLPHPAQEARRAEEMTRLQQEQTELLRLRNQVRELREQLAALEKRSSSPVKTKRGSPATNDETPGEVFLRQNSGQPDVVALPSGLQYKVLALGTGPMPGSNDTVRTHYRATLIDGTEFDNSYKRGEPAAFPVRSVIKGWEEALQLMPVGSKWQLFIPAALAYGERGAGEKVPPDSVLLFEVELLSIDPK